MQRALQLLFYRAEDAERDTLQKLMEVSIQTVDAAQGAESDIVLASLVRANSRQDTGFIADARRSNVLLSKARITQITVGHAPTLTGSNWNDYPGLFGIFDETGGLFCSRPDGTWHPASTADLLADRQVPPARAATPYLDDALWNAWDDRERDDAPREDLLTRKRAPLPPTARVHDRLGKGQAGGARCCSVTGRRR
jgi:hypothetical protein